MRSTPPKAPRATSRAKVRVWGPHAPRGAVKFADSPCSRRPRPRYYCVRIAIPPGGNGRTQVSKHARTLQRARIHLEIWPAIESRSRWPCGVMRRPFAFGTFSTIFKVSSCKVGTTHTRARSVSGGKGREGRGGVGRGGETRAHESRLGTTPLHAPRCAHSCPRTPLARCQSSTSGRSRHAPP